MSQEFYHSEITVIHQSLSQKEPLAFLSHLSGDIFHLVCIAGWCSYIVCRRAEALLSCSVAMLTCRDPPSFA